jgi:hypothetical protein
MPERLRLYSFSTKSVAPASFVVTGFTFPGIHPAFGLAMPFYWVYKKPSICFLQHKAWV